MRATNQFDPFASVEIEPVLTSEGIETKRSIVKVKDDEGKFQPVSSVSSGYQLITNEQAQQVVTDVQTRSRFTWQELRPTFFDGKRFLSYYMSEENIGKVSNGIKRTMRVGMLARNSYDGSCRFGIQMFMAMLECSNQFIHPNLFGSFLLRHTTGEGGSNMLDPEDAAEQISRQANVMLELAPAIGAMKESGVLTIDDLRDAKQKVAIAPTKWGNVLDHIEADNRFGLMNALTYVASHDIDGMASVRAGESIGRYFLDNDETVRQTVRGSKVD